LCTKKFRKDDPQYSFDWRAGSIDKALKVCSDLNCLTVFCQKWSLEMKRGVFNMTRKANGKAVDNNDISKRQRSSYDEITNEENSNHFLPYQRYCTFLIRSTRPNSQPGLLCRDTDDVKWSCA
jgi:hypothetical protein